MSSIRVAVGVDIGGTNTVFGLVDREGNLISEGHVPTTAFAEIDDYVNAVAQGIRDLEGYDRLDVCGVGIGAPNGNFYRGTIEHAPNLNWKGIVPLADMMQERLECPVYVTNDANAAAIGEMIYGAARDMRDFVLITLGTGLGSGFVANGDLIYGHDGFAGELGHVTAFRQEGRLCGCGRKDCLETYVSATGLVNTTRAKLQASKRPSSLRDYPLEKIESKQVAEAAAAGDSLALDVFDETAEILGFALGNTAAITSPRAYIFFGGLALAGELLLEPARNYMEQFVPPFYKGKIDLLVSDLHDRNAAILGGAALLWSQLPPQK